MNESLPTAVGGVRLRTTFRSMATDPTIGELFKQALVLDADVRAAVDAYMADTETGVFPVGEGYGLDLAAAVDANGPAKRALADPSASNGFKRTGRTALLLSAAEAVSDERALLTIVGVALAFVALVFIGMVVLGLRT